MRNLQFSNNSSPGLFEPTLPIRPDERASGLVIISPQGGCYCGAVRYVAEGEPVLRATCGRVTFKRICPRPKILGFVLFFAIVVRQEKSGLATSNGKSKWTQSIRWHQTLAMFGRHHAKTSPCLSLSHENPSRNSWAVCPWTLRGLCFCSPLPRASASASVACDRAISRASAPRIEALQAAE